MKDLEEINRLRREKYQINKEHILSYNKKYRLKNKEKFQKLAKKYYQEKREIKIQRQKDYYQKHREEKAAYNKNYRLKNKEVYKQYINNYVQTRSKIDLDFKLKNLLRDRLRKAIKHEYKSGSAVDDLGCSIESFKAYLTEKFQPGMTWENYGRYGWHIDHIRPLASFDLTIREEFQQAVHYTNLQPLWAKDNLAKSDKYDQIDE